MGSPIDRPRRALRPDLTEPRSHLSATAYGSPVGTHDEQHKTEMAAIVAELRMAVETDDTSTLGDVLDPDVTWGDCAGRDAVLGFLDAATATIGSPENVSFTTIDDRVVASFALGTDQPELSVAIFVRQGKITEFIDATDEEHGRFLRPVGELSRAAGRGWHADRLSPVLPVADLAAAADRYRTLGFDVRTYEGDAAYAFATHGPVEIHLTQVRDLDPTTNTSAIYLYVNDADATYATWRLAGAEGRLVPPTDTDYGLREGAYIDPDGNLIRFGCTATSALTDP